jgi:hypothetical protein
VRPLLYFPEIDSSCVYHTPALHGLCLTLLTVLASIPVSSLIPESSACVSPAAAVPHRTHAHPSHRYAKLKNAPWTLVSENLTDNSYKITYRFADAKTLEAFQKW